MSENETCGVFYNIGNIVRRTYFRMFHSSGKYTVTNNGAPVKVSRVKGEPFLYAGKIGSGSYTFVVN